MQSQQTKLTNFKQFNEKYDCHMMERDFTESEFQILNSEPPLNFRAFDLTNPDVLYAMVTYYDTVQKDQKKQYTCIQKLIEMNDNRGYLKMGVYCEANDDFAGALTNFTKAAAMGNAVAKYNLAILHMDLRPEGLLDLNVAEKHLLELVGENLLIAYPVLVKCYAMKGDEASLFTWIQKGILAGSSDCIDLFSHMFQNKTDLYMYLNSLEPKNDAICQKMTEILPLVDMRTVDTSRGTRLLLVKEDNTVVNNEFKHLGKITDEEIALINSQVAESNAKAALDALLKPDSV